MKEPWKLPINSRVAVNESIPGVGHCHAAAAAPRDPSCFDPVARRLQYASARTLPAAAVATSALQLSPSITGAAAA